MEQINTTTNIAAAMIDGSLYALASLLDAFKAGVIVPADDIPRDQRAEIRRELSCMVDALKRAMEARELPILSGSIHLQRRNKPGNLPARSLIDRAAAALMNRSKRDGFVFQQPDSALSTFDYPTQTLTLRNCNGVLATFRYNVKANRLTYVEAQS